LDTGRSAYEEVCGFDGTLKTFLKATGIREIALSIE
jgi:hypothetical protein